MSKQVHTAIRKCRKRVLALAMFNRNSELAPGGKEEVDDVMVEILKNFHSNSGHYISANTWRDIHATAAP
jgi:hypothetical protein